MSLQQKEAGFLNSERSSSMNENSMQAARILFVDDDTFVLRSLRRTMKRVEHWVSEFESNPQEALVRLQREPFDIVVSDYSMPEMTGMDFLRRVQEISPGSVRIIMTGGVSSEVSSDLVHQKWTKPWVGPSLISGLDHIVQIRRQLREPRVQQYVGNVDKLPSPPEVVTALLERLADPESTAQSLADVIGADPGMAAKILQLCNSAFLGVQREVHSVQQGVVLLGKRAIGNLVLAEAIYRTFESKNPIPGFEIATLRQDCLVRAQIACELFTEPQARDDAFAAGLLSDTGLLILAHSCPTLLRDLLAEAGRTGTDINDLIARELGTSHANIGAYLLGIWGIAAPVVESVLFQFHPKPPSDRKLEPADAVYLTRQLIMEYQSLKAPLAESAHVLALSIQDDVPRWQLSTRRIVESGRPRAVFRHRVRWPVSWTASSSLGHGFALDASPSGIFLSLDEEGEEFFPPEGTEITLTIQAAPPQFVHARAVVRWTGYSAQHDRTGIGLQILDHSYEIERVLASQ